MQPCGFSPLWSFLSCMEPANLEHPCPCDAESQRDFIVRSLPWTVFTWEFLVLSVSRRKPAFTLDWISMQPLFKINTSPSSQPSTFPSIHSLVCIRLAAATGLAGHFSHVSPGQHSQARLWSPPRRGERALQWVLDAPQRFSFHWLHLEYLQKDALRWHLIQIQDPLKLGHSTPSSALQMSRSLAHLLYSSKHSPSRCGSSFYVTVCAHYLGLHAEHTTGPMTADGLRV